MSNIFFTNFVLTIVWGYLLLFNYSETLTQKKRQRNKKWFVILVSVQWILISGLRGDGVGADTSNYMNMFDKIAYTDWGKIFQYFPDYYLYGKETFEIKPGFVLFEKIIRSFTASRTVYKFVVATIFTSSLGMFIYKNSEKPMLSFFAV